MMKSRHHLALLMLLVPMLLAAGCKKQREAVKDVLNIRSKVMKTYDLKEVGVQVLSSTGKRFLVLSVVNSKLNSLPKDSQKGEALKIARYVAQEYEQMDKTDGVTIVLVKGKRIGPLAANMSSPYSFTRAELVVEPSPVPTVLPTPGP